MMKVGFVLLMLGLLAGPAVGQDEEKLKALEERIEKLEKANEPVVEKIDLTAVIKEQQLKARERINKDLQVYSKLELREIESLYQVANAKWRTQQGKDSLKLLIDKYDKANRTGCALLYLGQMSQGDEREKYLLDAIDDFSDCYYGDGVQVGAYARYVLAYHYKETGDREKEMALLEELKRDYPHAITHKGKLIADSIAGELKAADEK